MKKTILVSSLALVVLFAAAAPFTASAQAQAFRNIWKDTTCAPDYATQGPTSPCTLCDGLVVASNIIYDLFIAATIAAALMIIAGGVVLMTAGASEKNVSTGKAMMLNAVMGLVIALAAWLAMNTLLGFMTGNPKLPWAKISCSETNITPPPIATQNNATSTNNNNNQTDNLTLAVNSLTRMIASGCQTQAPVCAEKNAANNSDQNLPKINLEAAYTFTCVKNSQGGYDVRSSSDCLSPVINGWYKCSDPLPDIKAICSQ